MSSTDRIRAVAHALTPEERVKRFRELREVVANQGGILLDPDQTAELVALGELLGVKVEWVRVELSAPAKDEQPTEPKKGRDERWKTQPKDQPQHLFAGQ